MQKSDKLEELTRKQLYQIYLDEEVGDAYSLKKLAKDNYLDFDTTKLVASSKHKRQETRDFHFQQFKDDIIAAIREAREARIPPPPKSKADDAKAKLIKYIDTPEYKHNQELIAEQQKKLQNNKRK